MIRNLVDKNDPILRQVMEKFDFKNPPVDPILLYQDLAQTMIENNGIGLSANQIGLPYRAFVMRAADVIGVFNPIIVDYSAETVTLEEGCLSYPNLFVKVSRPKKIKARYTLPNGEVVTQVFDGITARCFQHEMDHLDGILYTKRANKFHLEHAKKVAKKFNKYPRLPKSELSEQTKEMLEWLKV